MKTSIIHIAKQSLALFIALGAVILVASFASAQSTWSGPTASAPGGNVAAPVNVGSDSQVKDGFLGSNTLVAAPEFCIPGSTPECINSWSDLSGTTVFNGGGGGGVSISSSVQAGTAPVSCKGGGGSYTVTFPQQFTAAPVVSISPKWERWTGDEDTTWFVYNVSASGFTVGFHGPDGGSCAGESGVMWIAVLATN